MRTGIFTLLLIISGALGASLFAADAPRDAKPAPQPATKPATLTDAEKQAGWRLIFDGTSTAGWRILGGTEFPKEQWTIRDNCLVHLAGKGGGHDLAYERPVEDFELAWEWMIPKAKGNSGVKYRVQETKGNGTALGCEYQMMDDGDVSDKNATGSLYDVLPPKGKKLNPAGQWNDSRIVARGNHVEHWLNGVKVLEFDFGSEEVKAAVAKSKFKGNPKWAAEPKGFIILQEHGDEAWFRNIRLKEGAGK